MAEGGGWSSGLADDVPVNVNLSTKSKRTRRIVAAHAFLKTISFDGKAQLNTDDILATKIDREELGPNQQQNRFDEDNFLISSLPAASRPPLHHCISLACAGNIEEDLVNQQSSSGLTRTEFKDSKNEAANFSKSKSFMAPSNEAAQERRLLKDFAKVTLVEPSFFLKKSVASLQYRRLVVIYWFLVCVGTGNSKH